MIPELGHFCLVLALCAAGVQAVLPLAGAHRGDRAWMGVAEPAALAQFALIAMAFVALTQAYVASDFSVLNVAENSHTLKPLIYKISGVWGNHEGSLLLWVLILSLFGALVALFAGDAPDELRARTLAVQALIAVGFLLFILLTSNPFARLDPPPLDGRDLNPLLQDPGLALHPPMLYVGYVGFSIVFAFAVAAMIEGKFDAAWARFARPWALLAWAFLTAGIGLGSWWAYYELGWGGFWFWDPVENASFMPWLAGAALIHSIAVVEKREALKTWTVLLAILTFSLSLLGTFLVRSGVLTSVHAFATDPTRGVFILGLLVLAVGGSLALYAWRAPRFAGGGTFAPVSREGALVLNNLFLVTACATVLLGTLYPLLHEAIGGEKISVGPPYFNAAFVPLTVPLVAAMGLGPMLRWRQADLPGVLSRLKVAGAVTVLGAFIALAVTWREGFWVALGALLALWLVLGTLTGLAERIDMRRGGAFGRLGAIPRSVWGMSLAHMGLAVVIAGVTGVTLLSQEDAVVLQPGETADAAGYQVTLKDVTQTEGPNYRSVEAVLSVSKNGGAPVILRPERRLYVVSGQGTTEAGIRSDAFGDLYATVGDLRPEGWTVRFQRKALAPWLWAGAAFMALGGFVSLSERRLVRGAVQPNAAPAPAE